MGKSQHIYSRLVAEAEKNSNLNSRRSPQSHNTHSQWPTSSACPAPEASSPNGKDLPSPPPGLRPLPPSLPPAPSPPPRPRRTLTPPPSSSVPAPPPSESPDPELVSAPSSDPSSSVTLAT